MPRMCLWRFTSLSLVSPGDVREAFRRFAYQFGKLTAGRTAAGRVLQTFANQKLHIIVFAETQAFSSALLCLSSQLPRPTGHEESLRELHFSI